MAKITETNKGLILDVYVKPLSKEFKIAVEGDEIVVHCLEEPVEGRVNKELVKKLSRLFGGRVELVSGFSSRQKRLLLKGVTKTQAERLLRGE